MDQNLESPQIRIVDIPVESDLQDYSFTVNRMWLDAIAYEDGDHCAFYALQEALIHFNQTALDLSTREKFQRERRRLVDLYKKTTGVEQELGAYLKISVAWILPKFEKAGIIPVRFICTEQTKQMLSGMRQLGKYDELLQKSSENTRVPIDGILPALFFSETPNTPHIWFCPDSQTYLRDEYLHKGPSDHYVLIAQMAKAQTEEIDVY